jgi:cytochrome c-type biogenesis protein
MTPRRCALARALLLGGALAALACGRGASAPAEDAGGGEAEQARPAREPAPDFTLTDLDGKTLRLSDFRGKTVVIDFWATWCPPCVYQAPELNKLWEAHREAGDLVVIGVAIDVEGASVVAPWVADHGIRYRIALGSEELAREFGAVGFPTLALIDAQGRLESLHIGLLDYKGLEALVAASAAATST